MNYKNSKLLSIKILNTIIIMAKAHFTISKSALPFPLFKIQKK